jgi:hypothetical protein
MPDRLPQPPATRKPNGSPDEAMRIAACANETAVARTLVGEASTIHSCAASHPKLSHGYARRLHCGRAG